MSDVERDQYLIEDEPYYLAVDSEVEIYAAACSGLRRTHAGHA